MTEENCKDTKTLVFRESKRMDMEQFQVQTRKLLQASEKLEKERKEIQKLGEKKCT